MTNTNSQSVNETFIKNMEEQLNVAKRDALTPEKRKEEFQRIKKTIEDYKNKRNLTPEELAKFEAIFAKIEEEYKKLNEYIQSQVAHIQISQKDGPKQMDKLRIQAESKYYEITGKNKTNPEKNGEENESRFKKGLSFVVQIANMDFKELGKSPENKEFVKDLPAVRGMAGAIVLKDLHERGYKISFEKDGKIKLDGRNSDNNAASLILNEQIERNPELGKILKEGLLFLDGDIQRYAAIYTDENGKNLDASKMTPENYLDYLKGRNDKGDAGFADKILLENPSLLTSLLNGMNLAEMAKSSQHLTPVLQKITQEVIQKQAKSTVNAQSNSTENTTIDTKTAREYYGEIADKVADLNWKENPVGSTAKAGYILLSDGTSAIFKDINESIKNSSNEEIAGAVILFVLSSVFVGFKKTLWGALGFAALGLGYKHTKEQLNGTNKAITIEQKEKQAEKIHTPEKANEALPITAQFRQSKLNDLNQYYKDGKGNLNEDLKKKLEDKKTKEYVKKEVDTANKGVEKMIAKTGSQLDEATKKEIKENITLQNALDLENATPEQLISQVKEVVKQAITEATDPEIRASLEELLKYLEKTDPSSIDWATIGTIVLIIATFGPVAAVGLIKSGLIGLAKVAGKFVWKITGGKIVNAVKKQMENKTDKSEKKSEARAEAKAEAKTEAEVKTETKTEARTNATHGSKYTYWKIWETNIDHGLHDPNFTEKDRRRVMELRNEIYDLEKQVANANGNEKINLENELKIKKMKLEGIKSFYFMHTLPGSNIEDTLKYFERNLQIAKSSMNTQDNVSLETKAENLKRAEIEFEVAKQLQEQFKPEGTKTKAGTETEAKATENTAKQKIKILTDGGVSIEISKGDKVTLNKLGDVTELEKIMNEAKEMEAKGNINEVEVKNLNERLKKITPDMHFAITESMIGGKTKFTLSKIFTTAVKK